MPALPTERPAPAPRPESPPRSLVERWIDACARHAGLVLLLSVLAAAVGGWALRHTPLDAIPDLSDVQVIVSTEWTGRSPDLIEDQITFPLSSRLVSAPKVKFVRGESMLGKSFVTVVFADGTDPYWARSRIVEALASARSSLPQGAEPTLGPDATGVGWVYEYALVDETGAHDLAALRALQDWHLRYALESVPGVAEVASVGGYVRAYQVDLDPDRLAAYGLSLADVVSKVRISNSEASGGTIELSSTEYSIRGHGYVKNLADLESIALRAAGGTPVLLRDVAHVHFGPDPRRGLVDLDGKGEVVGGIVVMRYGENALAVIDGVKRKLSEVAPALPAGVKIVPTYDRSVLIENAIATLRKKLLTEAVIVALVSLVFLWHFRSAVVVVLSLTLALLLCFAAMRGAGVSSNLMSLGGIAIAVGAMVDAIIIMVENAHRQLDVFRERHGREPSGAERIEVVISAARSVGRPLFFSLLVITVSFLPIFALGGQEGRLFKPLAWTKTFAMGFAALTSITVAPALMVWLVRGRITAERQNPLNRFLIASYRPIVDVVLRFRWAVLMAAALILALSVWPIRRIGREFMPPLNEGTILFMPSAVPGISIAEAKRVLMLQDRLLHEIPEVDRVFGKAGQAETATDPAPLSMFETVVTLKPRDQWLRGATWDSIVAEIDAKLKLPGMANIIWMPIQTRIEMLTTGFRSPLGLKVFGLDPAAIDALETQLEAALADLPGTRGIFAERSADGHYLDFDLDRSAIARYGLTVGEVNDAIETAIGGAPAGQVVEGRERHPITVRYARDFRDDPEVLKHVRITAPSGAQALLGELATVHFRSGPASIRSENAQLVGLVFIDSTAADLSAYVRQANARIGERITFPPGTYVQWAGQFEYLREVEKRLAAIVPFTVLLVFILIYWSTRSWARALIVLLAVPFSLVGAFALLWALHYHLSVAAWVGLIALAGLDAETGVVMLLYLDQAWDRFAAEGKLRDEADLRAAIREGAAQRIRPKIMTLCAILFGLLPVLMAGAAEAGADVMKPIAAPMVGGVVSSAVLELLLYPVIYYIWRRRHLPAETVKWAEQRMS